MMISRLYPDTPDGGGCALQHGSGSERMPRNEAAWLVGKHRPLVVKEAPYPAPGHGEIVVRNRAVAINPVDWIKPYIGDRMFGWIKYPFVLGMDLAGEVVATGPGVTAVKVGDRVLAMATGAAENRNRASEGAFQLYTVALERLTTVIPDSLSFTDACVIPLGLTTAACGLFQDDLLGLALPTATRKPGEAWVIVWGGATSVGCNAIQLAVAAGYNVVTTSSPKNFDYMRGLGAAQVFDYRSKTVVRDIARALRGKTVVGALAIGARSTPLCIDVLAQCEGRKFVASCSAAVSFDAITGDRPTLGTMLRLLPALAIATARTRRKSRRAGIPEKFFDASSVIDNAIGPAIYRDFLGPALAAGRFRAAPPAKVVGHSLAEIQKAFAIQRAGVSATKIVVELP